MDSWYGCWSKSTPGVASTITRSKPIRRPTGPSRTTRLSSIEPPSKSIETRCIPWKTPAGHLNRRPLVTTFRARGANPSEAFTFTLINVYVDTENAGDDSDVLEAVYDAASQRLQGEDDLILLGTLRADAKKLAWLEKRFRLTAVITNVPTTTRGTQIADNILLPRPAAVEYTGRSGVLDLLSEFGLSMQETLEVSENLPVWAEFSVYEGGQPGQVPSGASR